MFSLFMWPTFESHFIFVVDSIVLISGSIKSSLETKTKCFFQIKLIVW